MNHDKLKKHLAQIHAHAVVALDGISNHIDPHYCAIIDIKHAAIDLLVDIDLKEMDKQ